MKEAKRIQLSQTGIALGPIKYPPKSMEMTITMDARAAAVIGLFAEVLTISVRESAAWDERHSIVTKIKNDAGCALSPTIQYVRQL
jgi:hypothetical protein